MAGPWQSYEEYQTEQALAAAVSDLETIRSIRPAHPQELFPESRGVIKQEPNIFDILDVNRYTASNDGYLSGFAVRSTMTDDSWSGAGRYSMEALG